MKAAERPADISTPKAANDTEHHLLTAKNLELISPDAWRKLSAETTEIRKMTYAYRRRVLESVRYDYCATQNSALETQR